MLDSTDCVSISSIDDDSIEDGEPDLMISDRCHSSASSSSSSSSSSTSAVRVHQHSTDRSHCQLSWADHRSHLMNYFESLYRRESMVDVTLVCPELSVRAHRVVLSACSAFLSGMLADNPSSHPVVILQDVRAWQLQALVHFMYCGEIVNVAKEDLPALIQLAETLKVRGLTLLESDRQHRHSDMAASAGIYLNRDLYSKSPAGEDHQHRSLAKLARLSSQHLIQEHHGNGFTFEHTSPLPRRKQARPRRRSGDSSTATPPSMMMSSLASEPSVKSLLMISASSPVQDVPEDLTVKKSPPFTAKQESEEANLDSSIMSREDTPLPVPSLKAESINSDSAKSEFSLTERNSLFSPGPSGPLTSCSSTPPTATSLLSMTPVHQSDRRKGQHSAPRGGPPRAWTNGDLTEALHQVWNRKMTTSQASRVFGIPYNSLLMYVRGKYGKSLKLDTLRKETLEGEAMALAASTRGSYKLAAAAAAAAAAAGSNSANSNGSSTSTVTAPTTAKAANTSSKATKTAVPNNNINNNNNNNEPTAPSKNLVGGFGSHHPLVRSEMEALSMAGLAAAGLGGFPNPYLSYFCDFTFPVPGMGGIGLSAPVAAALKHQQHKAVEKKTDLRSSDNHRHKIGKRDKDITDTDVDRDDGEEEGSRRPSPPPLRLARSLMQATLDLSQTGQV